MNPLKLFSGCFSFSFCNPLYEQKEINFFNDVTEMNDDEFNENPHAYCQKINPLNINEMLKINEASDEPQAGILKIVKRKTDLDPQHCYDCILGVKDFSMNRILYVDPEKNIFYQKENGERLEFENFDQALKNFFNINNYTSEQILPQNCTLKTKDDIEFLYSAHF